MNQIHKTQVKAEPGHQEIFITRIFDLPADLLFKAYTDPHIVAQWMGTTVHKLENKNHGSYHFISTDPRGQDHGFNGTIHSIKPNQSIVRTFEMEGGEFPPQLEFLEFEPLTENTSRLQIHMILKSVEVRDQMLKLPFQFGINMAHNQLEKVIQTWAGQG